MDEGKWVKGMNHFCPIDDVILMMVGDGVVDIGS